MKLSAIQYIVIFLVSYLFLALSHCRYWALDTHIIIHQTSRPPQENAFRGFIIVYSLMGSYPQNSYKIPMQLKRFFPYILALKPLTGSANAHTSKCRKNRRMPFNNKILLLITCRSNLERCACEGSTSLNSEIEEYQNISCGCYERFHTLLIRNQLRVESKF